MVNVRKPNKPWKIQEIISSESGSCRHLFFPADYYGCKHQERSNKHDIPECIKADCPIKTP